MLTSSRACQPDILLTSYAAALNTLVRNMPELQFSFTSTAMDCDISFSAQDCTPIGHPFLPFETEAYDIALARDHLLSHATSLALKDVAKYPIIARKLISFRSLLQCRWRPRPSMTNNYWA